MGVYEPHPGECEMIRLTRFVAQSEGREPRRFDELPTRSWAGSGRPFDRLRVSGGAAIRRRARLRAGRRAHSPQLLDPFGVVQVCRPDRRCGPPGQVSANAKGSRRR